MWFFLVVFGSFYVGIEKMDYWRNLELEIGRGYVVEGKGLRKLKVLIREGLK